MVTTSRIVEDLSGVRAMKVFSPRRICVIVIVLNEVKYQRDYKINLCDLPGCGKRIQFRLNAKGVPETSDKYNKRRCCCDSHSRELQQQRLPMQRKNILTTLDKFLYGQLYQLNLTGENHEWSTQYRKAKQCSSCCSHH